MKRPALRWIMVCMEPRTRLAPSTVTLSGLYVYPIKSCAGIPLQSADLSATGLRHDRSWMLVDETGEFMSQRAHPRMALISIRFSAEHLIVSAPGMEELEIPLYPQAESSIDVRVWGDTNRGELVTEEANRWFTEFLKFPCRLVHKPEDDPRLVDSSFAESGDQVGFADGFAFLLISEASLEDLNMRLEDPLLMNRFRPNFVVKGCGPYAEDGWSRLRIGSVPFRVAEPCPRYHYRRPGDRYPRQRTIAYARNLPKVRRRGLFRPQPDPRHTRYC